MTGERCVGFGRVIDTDCSIAGTIVGKADRDDAAIIVRQQPAAAMAAPPLWSGNAAALDFAPPGVARYRCTGRSIDIIPAPDPPAGMIDALLLATALPAVLWLAGSFVLHAAAVVPAGEDGALAIGGPSSSGKSRLAAALLARGADLLADDSIALTCDPGGVTGTGLPGGYHLGAPGSDERPFHPVPPERARRSARLAAIVILDAHTAAPTPLRGVDAVAALLAHRHRPSVPRHAGLEPRSLRDAACLARMVPVYRWPRDEADGLLDEHVRAGIMQD